MMRNIVGCHMASQKLKKMVKQRQRLARQNYHIHSQVSDNYAQSVKVDVVAMLERNIKNQEMVA